MIRYLLFLFILFCTTDAFSIDVPLLKGRVNDYAGMLTVHAAEMIERQLADFERTDSTQFVVLIVPSIENESIEEYAIKIGESWKIGQKGKDNGAILLIAQKERRIKIEVGRGLEGKLTDLVSGRIVRDIIAPSFKANDFDKGVIEGVAAMIAVVRGEYKASASDVGHSKRKSSPPILTFLIFLAVGSVFLGTLNRFLGGIVSAIGLPIIAYFSYPGLAILMLAGLGLLGFIAGLLLTIIFNNSGSGYHGGGFWWGGGYGSSSGGSSGSDTFSGGGGDFGGGGASGDW